MAVHCIVCGKPLYNPVSIARRMGPKCAGVASAGKSFHSSQRIRSGTTYPSIEASHETLNLFSFIEEQQDRVPQTLKKFPSDLVELVLSAPAAGSIAAQIKLYSRRKKKQNSVPAVKLLKQIRRMCIEFRLPFWPGLSMNLEPIPCIPYGENDWKIGENGRVFSKDELVAYLSRYGIISQEQIRTSEQTMAPMTVAK
jgi:hypothetical protein